MQLLGNQQLSHSPLHPDQQHFQWDHLPLGSGSPLRTPLEKVPDIPVGMENTVCAHNLTVGSIYYHSYHILPPHCG